MFREGRTYDGSSVNTFVTNLTASPNQSQINSVNQAGGACTSSAPFDSRSSYYNSDRPSLMLSDGGTTINNSGSSDSRGHSGDLRDRTASGGSTNGLDRSEGDIRDRTFQVHSSHPHPQSLSHGRLDERQQQQQQRNRKRSFDDFVPSQVSPFIIFCFQEPRHFFLLALFVIPIYYAHTTVSVHVSTLQFPSLQGTYRQDSQVVRTTALRNELTL